MPGKPLPAGPPRRPSLSGEQARQKRQDELTDRRIDQGRTRELLVHIGPDQPNKPGARPGRAWLKPLDETT